MTAEPVELHPGLWRLPLPLDGHSVGHVNVYAFVDDDGVLLVDTGWGLEGTWERLDGLLAVAGARVDEVVGALLTHVHPDHCGLARQLQRKAGAWVGMHEHDASLVPTRYADAAPYLRATDEWLAEVGGPPDFSCHVRGQVEDSAVRAEPFTPDIALTDGRRVTHGRWELVTVHTPGHTPGHACFHEARTRTLLSGDHVLPRIRVSPTYRPQAVADPVGSYLATLDQLGRLTVDRVLPGHQRPFTGLGERLATLRDYHHQRLEETLGLVAEQPGTVWDLCARVARSRPWERLRPAAKVAALGETYAHLVRLAAIGAVEASEELPRRWSLAP